MRVVPTVLAALTAAWLTGCPGKAAPGAAGGDATAVGVRLTYLLHTGPGAVETHEVVASGPTEVVTRVRAEVSGSPAGEPFERRFPVLPAPADLEGGEAGLPLRLGPLSVETWVVTDGAVRTTWAVRGRRPIFPGIVRVERGDELLVELSAVTGP